MDSAGASPDFIKFSPLALTSLTSFYRRPLSKTVRFNVISIDRAVSGKGGKQFGGM